jgi:alkyl hydroperoxide reductase subunit F
MESSNLAAGLSALGRENLPDPGRVYHLLVLGGGPAATTAMLYAARKFLDAALLTKDFQGQVGTTNAIENYMGYQTINGRELAAKFYEQIRQFDLPMAQDVWITRVRREGDLFAVEVDGGAAYRAHAVVVATGKRDRVLGVPGEKELAGRGVAYCATCDAPFFRGLKVAVAGGGNSGFTAALDLLKVAAEVTLINVAEGWQADAILQASARKHDHVRFLERHEITAIEGDQVVTGLRLRDRATGAEKRIDVDGVFVEIGLVPNSEPVRGLVELNAAGEIVIDCFCRTGVAGLFAAGDVTTIPQKQIIISAGEGAKASLMAYDYLTRKGLL